MSRVRRLHRTLLGRSLLLGVLPAAIVVLAIVALNGVRGWNRLSTDLERELRAATDLVSREIDLANARNIMLASTLAQAQEAGQFGRRAESLRLLDRILRTNPQAYAAYVAYEPDADGNDAAGAAPGVPAEALGEGGRFFPYLKRDPKAPGGIRLEPLEFDPEDGGLWYEYPKTRYERSGVRDPLITKPYEYLGVDIIENVAPIVVDGRFVGVAGVDVSLALLQARIDEVARRVGADVFVETRGFIVAASTDSTKGTALRRSATANWPLAARLADAPREGVAMTTADDSELGEECRYLVASVPTGGWRVLVRKPTSEIAAQIVPTIALNLATALVGVAVIVALLSLGAVGISRRVRAAEASATRIASGDLSGQIEVVRGSDESAELLRVMGRMNDDLATIVEAVRAASTRLAAASAQLAATSREQDASTRGLSGSTGQIAAAVREIAATGTELLRTVEAVDLSARRTAESATRGRRDLEAISASIGRLDAGTSSISARLETISEKAQAISGVVESMAKVAEQSNLLSVNAAIEAEKAGDAGLGFLVVAREMRRLAEQTAIASQDIARIVGQMQHAVGDGVSEMTRFAGEMRAGNADAQQVATALGAIIEDMAASFARFSEVRTGMADQSAGVAQIESAADHLAEGARHASASVAESAKVAEELALAVAVLQDAVARFRVRGDGGA